MKKLIALSLVCALSGGCATASSKWEVAAMGAAVADLASTQAALSKGGFREANPMYGSGQPSAEKMLAINAAVYGGVWALTRTLDPVQKQRMWRTVAVLRLLAAGWNVSQNGCACFKASF
jgi:hypothetical protein